MNNNGSLLQILEVFKDRGSVLGSQQVADAVRKDLKVVSGMLDTLVHLGRLEYFDRNACELCPLRTACAPSDSSRYCYRLVP